MKFTPFREVLAVLALTMTLSSCGDSSYDECLDYMRSDAVDQGIQMDQEQYAVNRCTEGDGVTPNPDWRDTL